MAENALRVRYSVVLLTARTVQLSIAASDRFIRHWQHRTDIVLYPTQISLSRRGVYQTFVHGEVGKYNCMGRARQPTSQVPTATSVGHALTGHEANTTDRVKHFLSLSFHSLDSYSLVSFLHCISGTSDHHEMLNPAKVSDLCPPAKCDLCWPHVSWMYLLTTRITVQRHYPNFDARLIILLVVAIFDHCRHSCCVTAQRTPPRV